VRPFRSGVAFAGDLGTGLRACLWSRVASRVLLQLAEVAAASSEALYEGVLAIPWEDHISPDGTLAVDATGLNDALRDTRFIAVRVKDAVVDRLRDRFGRRPSVNAADPDVRINVALRGSKAAISIDLAGEPLHRRGYRTAGVQAAAPLKENLAAAVVMLAGWRAIAEEGGAFCDPLCGSGTLAIEAALLAGDAAPGLLRARWGFDRWLGGDPAVWDALLDDADARAEKGRSAIPPVLASDADAAVLAIAEACVRSAGLAGAVRLERRALADAAPPDGGGHGLVCCNPPYGERLGDRETLATLHRELGSALRGPFAACDAAILTADEALDADLGLRAGQSYDLFNGAIPTKLWLFSAGERKLAPAGRPAAVRRDRDARPVASAAPAALPAPEVDATAFRNRLDKMARHVGKWARKSGVNCYRVYDADLPDFAIAVDVYLGAGPDAGRRFAHVAEYAPPAEIEPALAAARLDAALDVIGELLEVSEADLFVKRRERQRGSTQYGRLGSLHAVHQVEESGLRFEVNLSDYLDTGLFLDHRPVRAMIRELAGGTRFLNLFAYTGTATVYAAAGGAASTTTVDLSATYLEWAGRNMALNGLNAPSHVRERADVLEWLSSARESQERYDLIFCDPPTFSTSKRMDDTFDVQRDHVRLILGASELLSEEGTLLFSCNRRGFRLDSETLGEAGLVARDITAQTIPKDFERTPKVHAVWRITTA
jgi:23S rRNA (guanine2445-N2)-methyltransferase / 23S rRNA (guanine2069-N7)-methyltransferase